MKREHRRAVEALHAVARPIILSRGWSRDSCIASTRIGILALAEFGVQARAQACEVVVMNEPYARVFAAIDHWPTADELPRDAHSLGIGIDNPELDDDNIFNGHVVIAGARWMLDLSIDQASRPQRGWTFDAPVFAQMPAGWTRPDQTHIAAHRDAVLVYITTAKRDFVDSVDWGMYRVRPAVRHVVEAMRAWMSSTRS